MDDLKHSCEDVLKEMKKLEKIPGFITARQYQRLTIDYTICKVVETIQTLSKEE